MTLWTQIWLGGLTALNVLMFWWAIVDDTRIKRLEGKL